MMKLSLPGVEPDLQPHIVVFGVGGAGGNAVNNMIQADLEGVEFVVANTDAQALQGSLAQRRLQLGTTVTRGLGAGARPDVGRAAAEEQVPDIIRHLQGANMAFITAGMGGGTGTGAAPVIARIAREQGILTIGVVTKPFHFEGAHRMRLAEAGIAELQQYVDTLIIIPNQNLFRIANQKTTFADAFKLADDVLHTGVRGVTDLMVLPGLINLDFADIRSVMTEMGQAMMGTGEASGERRALEAAEAAISNPLLNDVAMKGARGVLINITGGVDMTLFEIDEAANRIRDEVDPDANIIFGSTFDPTLDGRMRVSMVATGIDAEAVKQHRIPQTDLRNAPGRARQAPAIPGVVSGPSARAGAVAQPAPVPPGRIPPAPVLSGLVHPAHPTVLPAGVSASRFAAPAQSSPEERRPCGGGASGHTAASGRRARCECPKSERRSGRPLYATRPRHGWPAPNGTCFAHRVFRCARADHATGQDARNPGLPEDRRMGAAHGSRQPRATAGATGEPDRHAGRQPTGGARDRSTDCPAGVKRVRGLGSHGHPGIPALSQMTLARPAYRR